jgi:hypothetical protein
MRSVDSYAAPVDTQFASRPSAHTYSVPVVRELPRPIPQGLSSSAW